MLPLSFRLVIFDTALLVKKSLTILMQNGRSMFHFPLDMKIQMAIGS